MEKLNGIIQNVIYTGEDNYAIISVKVPKIKNTVTASGKIEYPVRKIGIYMEGTWGVNKARNQKQFYVTKAICNIDKKTGVAIRFLASGLVKYIGEATAREIVTKYGTDLTAIMECPEKLIQIKGITVARIPDVIETYKKSKPLFEIFEAANGAVTCGQAEKIYQKYKDKSAEMLKKNPYILIYDIKGFGFRTADLLAREMGMALDGKERCRAGLLHCFRTAAEEKGHCYLYYQEAIQRVVNLLINAQEVRQIYYNMVLKTSIPDDLSEWAALPLGDMAENHVVKFHNLIEKIEEIQMDGGDITALYNKLGMETTEIECMETYLDIKRRIFLHVNDILKRESFDASGLNSFQAYELVQADLACEHPKKFAFDMDKHGDIRYYDSCIFMLELRVVIGLIYLSRKEKAICYTDDECKNFIADYEKGTGMYLGSEQKEAVKISLQNRAFIITGGPGRGKTTIEDVTIRAWKKKEGEVMLLAPTGRAAQRMTETTGVPAKTIHRELLKPECFGDTSGKWLVLVDEMSMCTLQLFDKLLCYADEMDVHIGFIGDADQLPCIGLGNVFEDMIRSEKIPCVMLRQCYRNAGSISQNADVINHGGSMRDFIQDHASKMFFSGGGESVQQNIIKIYEKMLEKYEKKDIAVLVPMRQKGLTCANELNRLIQNNFNPPKAAEYEVRHEDKVFRVGDRVIHLKNTYKLEYTDVDGDTKQGIFNGETGEIKKANASTGMVMVRFDDGKTAVYDKRYLKFLDLAYATTIHKAQGSEYPCLITALVDGDFTLLTRKIFYTSVTRAKQIHIFVGTSSAAAKAITNAFTERRNTTIAERLSDDWDMEVKNPWDNAGEELPEEVLFDEDEEEII